MQSAPAAAATPSRRSAANATGDIGAFESSGPAACQPRSADASNFDIDHRRWPATDPRPSSAAANRATATTAATAAGSAAVVSQWATRFCPATTSAATTPIESG